MVKTKVMKQYTLIELYEMYTKGALTQDMLK